MTRSYYEPIKLSQTTRYPGYQFHAGIRIDGMDGFSAFRYVILIVFGWMLERIPEGDRAASELQLPGPEKCAEIPPEDFRSYHFSVGYALDITPLMYEGLWAMRLKEPDQGTSERAAVPQRFFTTRIGIRLDEQGFVELAIRIDVTDPADAEEEVPYAFRPGFVRKLFAESSVHVEQVQELLYDKAIQVKTEDDYRKLLYLLDSEDNQLPLAVFTYARPGKKAGARATGSGISMEDLTSSDPLDAFLQLTGSRTKTDFPGFGSAAEKKTESAQVLPYDADAFCGKAFGYAVTFVLGDAFTERFRSRIRKEFAGGDILLCGARKFRGGVNVFSCAGESVKERDRTFKDAVMSARKYSKHKSLYSFGKTVFEAEARKMELQKEFRRILESGQMEEKDRYDRLVQHAEELSGVINSKDEKIAALEKQCAEEFDRGVAFRDNEYATLEEENSRLKKELADEQEKNRQMLGEHQWAKNVLGALDQVREVAELPADNAGVVRYFMRVYSDRLGFTERGEWEASRCGLRTDHLWEILYMTANDLANLFREKEGNLTEEDVTRVAGCEAAMQEGSMTRKDSAFMKLREDEYEGKTISVEPHLKLKSVKGEPQHQRLHFCYDPELKKIIIGYLGDHLDSAATRYAKKR